MYTDPYRLDILKLGILKLDILKGFFFNSVTAFLHSVFHSNIFVLIKKL